MDIPFARYLPVARTLKNQMKEHRVTGLAAEVAFFGVLSIFPGLLMVTAALGSLDAFVGSDLAALSKKQVVDFLNLILTAQARPAIAAIEDLFERGRDGLLTVASVAAIVGLSRAFAVVTSALNLAYGTKETRPWLKQRLLGVALSVATVVMTVLMLVLIVVGPLFGEGGEVAERFGLTNALDIFWSFIRWPFAFAMLVAWATALFHLAPCRQRPRWFHDLAGAVVTAVLWLMVSVGLKIYLAVAAGANPVFGVLGGGLILLVWLYLLSLALLIGGELNPLLIAYRRDKRSGATATRGPSGPP